MYKRWKVTIKERGNDHLLTPELWGEYDEDDVVRHFGLKEPDVEWYKMEERKEECNNTTIKILDLPLKKEWYDMIKSGEKREEYRIDKPYWRKRLLRCYKSIDWCDDSVSCSKCSVFRRKLFRKAFSFPDGMKLVITNRE